MDKEFFTLVDGKVQAAWEEIKVLISKTKISIFTIEFEVELNEEEQNQFEINKDIRFVIKSNPDGGKISYYYDGIEIDPDCYYVRPVDYHEVSTLKIIQECIKQKTHKPDIKFLERGEDYEEKTNT